MRWLFEECVGDNEVVRYYGVKKKVPVEYRVFEFSFLQYFFSSAVDVFAYMSLLMVIPSMKP